MLNTYQAMIVPGVAFLIPTAIWLLKSYFEKIPVDLKKQLLLMVLHEYKYSDILSHLLSTPGLVVVGIYAFIGAYAQQFLICDYV